MTKIYTLEIKLADQHNMIERTLFYWAKLYTENFKKGEEYLTLKKTITINILNFNLLSTDKFHSSYQIYEKKDLTLLTDLLDIHFIEYPKFKKHTSDLNNALHRWLLFLQEDVPERTLREVIDMDPVIANAESKLRRLSEDEETRRLYELREKYLSDLNTNLTGARRDERELIAKNLLKRFPSMSVNDVSETTGLPIQRVMEIEKEVR
jgi:predicted transposase/invertase (TIGR01784 family)